jgi:hypothetical protein
MLDLTDLRRPLPAQWKLFVSVDTGTYMSATFTAFPPDSIDGFVVEEFPNYRYIGGAIELLGGTVGSVPGWSRWVLDSYRKYVPHKTRLHAWCDENSQFKTELRNYGIIAQGNKRKLELRVEITREYFINRHAHLAPWLSVLPWEIEHAVWPDEASSAGRFEREKDNDHTLDTIEHTFSRRPRHSSQVTGKKQSFVERWMAMHARPNLAPRVDPHLGSF